MNIFTTTFASADATFDAPRISLRERLSALFDRATQPSEKTDSVEAFIQANGGVMTDQLERDISRRFGSMAGR